MVKNQECLLHSFFSFYGDLRRHVLKIKEPLMQVTHILEWACGRPPIKTKMMDCEGSCQFLGEAGVCQKLTGACSQEHLLYRKQD